MDKLVVKVSNKLTSPASTSDTVVAQGSASPETSTCNGSSTQGSTTSTSGAIGAGFEGTPKIGLAILSSL